MLVLHYTWNPYIYIYICNYTSRTLVYYHHFNIKLYQFIYIGICAYVRLWSFHRHGQSLPLYNIESDYFVWYYVICTQRDDSYIKFSTLMKDTVDPEITYVRSSLASEYVCVFSEFWCLGILLQCGCDFWIFHYRFDLIDHWRASVAKFNMI